MGSTEDFNVIICLKYSIETNFWMYLLKKKPFMISTLLFLPAKID